MPRGAGGEDAIPRLELRLCAVPGLQRALEEARPVARVASGEAKSGLEAAGHISRARNVSRHQASAAGPISSPRIASRSGARRSKAPVEVLGLKSTGRIPAVSYGAPEVRFPAALPAGAPTRNGRPEGPEPRRPGAKACFRSKNLEMDFEKPGGRDSWAGLLTSAVKGSGGFRPPETR